MKRLCIYPKDVVRITGVGLRKAQKELKRIREIHNKQKHQYVTIKEFASYADIDPDTIELD